MTSNLQGKSVKHYTLTQNLGSNNLSIIYKGRS